MPDSEIYLKDIAMLKNLSASVNFSLQYEGGFVDDPHDPGGATNKGITLATYRLDTDPHGAVADLRHNNQL